MASTKACLCFLALLSLGQAQNSGSWQIEQQVQSCSTPNGRPGRCILVQQCEPLMVILRNPPLSNQALQFMRQSQCGFQGRIPLVCCTNTNTNYPDPNNPGAVSSPNIPNSPGRATEARPAKMISVNGGRLGEASTSIENHRNRVLLPTQECGLDFSQRIFGGNITDLDEFPWTALLRYRGRDGREKLLCGGVVISRRYVLTAAHCSSKGDLAGNRLIGVRLGEHDTGNAIDCEDRYSGPPICASEPINYGIEEEIAHPEYQKSSTNQYNDIALLRLNANVLFNTDFIKPICLPTSSEVLTRVYVGEGLTVAGWGRTQHGKNSPIKLKVNVPVVANSECSKVYAAQSRQITNRQMCAGGVFGQDSCSGDSGGPLMSADKLTDGQQLRFHVTGIVSYGPNPCGKAGWPGVYTRVSEYSKWILDQMRE